MEIRHLQTFQVVAEELNLTRAAMKLNYSQPTITKHLKILEDEIGVPLLKKSNGKRSLTKAGEILYNHSNEILKEIYLLNNEISISQGDKQLIRLCCPDYYCYHYFIPAIEQFRKTYPEISFEINATSSDQTLKNILQNEADFGIVIGKQIPSEIRSFYVGYEDLVLFASNKIAKSPNDKQFCIDHYPVLVEKKAKYINYGYFKQGLTFPAIIDCNSDESIKKGVLNNRFIGIVGTGRIQKEIDSGEIVVLDTYAYKEPIKFITHKNSKNKYMSNFLKFFSTHYKVSN